MPGVVAFGRRYTGIGVCTIAFLDVAPQNDLHSVLRVLKRALLFKFYSFSFIGYLQATWIAGDGLGLLSKG